MTRRKRGKLPLGLWNRVLVALAVSRSSLKRNARPATILWSTERGSKVDYLLLFERRRQLKEGSVHIVKREKERKATISRVAVERKNIRKKTKTAGKKLFDQSASANVKRRVSVCHSRRMCIDSCKYIQPKIADEFPYRGIKLSLSLSFSTISTSLRSPVTLARPIVIPRASTLRPGPGYYLPSLARGGVTPRGKTKDGCKCGDRMRLTLRERQEAEQRREEVAEHADGRSFGLSRSGAAVLVVSVAPRHRRRGKQSVQRGGGSAAVARAAPCRIGSFPSSLISARGDAA